MERDLEKEIAAIRNELKDLRDLVSALYGMIAEDDEDWTDSHIRRLNT